MTDGLLYEREPALAWRRDDLDAFLLWAADLGASDIVLTSGIKPRVRLHGRWLRVGVRTVETQASMVPALIETTRAQDAWARVQGREFMDYAYEVPLPGTPWKKRRFRVDATACRDGNGVGLSIVFRTIPSLPPRMDDLGIEAQLRGALFPNNGLVLVTGVMGSGKSTTLAAVLREIIETTDKHVLTFEAPTEFDLMSLNDTTGAGAFVVQSEIGLHLSSFDVAPKNSTRRAADVVLYGEARDPETVGGMIEQAEVGTAVYATAHTPSVAATPGRVINVFPSDDQPSMAAGFLGAIRLIVQQRLLKTCDGKRVAVREWLAFDETMRTEMLSMPLSGLYAYLDRKVHECGMPLLRSAKRLFDAGIIEETEYVQIVAEKRLEAVAAGGDVA
ncbi:MAG: Flp pilus assembly complex ATPase component TadA [Burkholderiales bacterium]|nr:Flp pilus assembly complex ATPase component TadA [Burkholderiales bacterium]